jgi:glycosyltransferase involved in cell wall biosynthesis
MAYARRSTSTDPHRIVRIITRLNVGGPARHVTILSTRVKPEFDCVLLTGESGLREGSLLNEAIAQGARVVRVPHLKRPLSPLADLLAFVWLVRYLRRERPAIVATHTAKAGSLGRLAAKLAGVPVIVHTFHGHVLEGYFGRITSSVFQTVERLLSLITTHFIAISPEIAEDLERLRIGLGKTSIVRLGLDLEHMDKGLRGRLRRDLGIPNGAPLVGIVGRLVPIKAHDLFLASAGLVVDASPTVHFAIIGDGELWDELHGRVAAAGLSDRVHFAGWRDDLPEVYADLDLVVCCSRNEGTPVSVIEACAAGCAVIGTPVGGMTSIIQRGVNGVLIPAGDANMLAAAISNLVADPARRQSMGIAGRRIALETFGANRMVAELKRIYTQLSADAASTGRPS